MDGRAVGAQAEELVGWLAADDARSAARAELRRHGLPHGQDQVDDVLGGVALRVYRRLARRGPLAGSVTAYARQAVTHAVVDLVRARRTVSLDELLADGDGADPRATEGPDPTDDARVAAEQLAEVRHALHAGLGSPRAETWPVAAALAAVTLSQGDVAPAPDLPRPDGAHGGAGQADLWAALAYAGQDRCFEQPDAPAVRNRRSAAIARVRRTVRQALDAVHGGAR